MEAKDTVMENLAQAIIAHPDLPMGQAIAIEQAEISFKVGIKEVIERLRRHKDYKIMARLVRGGYRNMTYDSDYELLLKEWGV